MLSCVSFLPLLGQLSALLCLGTENLPAPETKPKNQKVMWPHTRFVAQLESLNWSYFWFLSGLRRSQADNVSNELP